MVWRVAHSSLLVERTRICFPSVRTNYAEFMPSCIQYNFRRLGFTALKTMAWRPDREQGLREGAEEMRAPDWVL